MEAIIADKATRSLAAEGGREVDGTRRAASPDAVIAELAAAQHGLVARRQLLERGVPGHLVEYRVKRRRLRPVHRGVYRAGPVAGPRAREMAAVLACGEAAVVSHRSAARTWDILSGSGKEGPVEVTLWRGQRAPGPGVRVHRSTDLPPEERTVLDGIPVTTPGRTLLDLARASALRALERAVARAERRGLTDREQLAALLARHPSRKGSPALRVLLERTEGPAMLRSEAEARLLELVRRARLEAPDVNALVHGYEVDFLWRAAGLVVEVDGFAFHSSRRAFEGDRSRDARLTAAGYRVMRTTWRQLDEEPEALLARLAQALARAARP